MRVSTSKHDGISMPKKDGEVGILKALQGCFANKQQVNVIGW
jgi:hypothetical protein